MVEYHFVQKKDVVRRQTKVFNDSTKWLLLFDEPSLRAKLRPSNEFTTSRTDGVVDLFTFDLTYNGLASPRIPVRTPTVAPEEILIDWKQKPTSLCFIRIATSQERCHRYFRGRWP
jgi:hypothetical protein